MLKIATHNSATGESPKNLLSWLVIPFARTQRKTLYEQFYSGCRLFDLRVRKCGKTWHCAHGLFTTKRTLENVLMQLNELAKASNAAVSVIITYEGKFKSGLDRSEFLFTVKEWQNKYIYVTFCQISVKYNEKGVWETICSLHTPVAFTQYFKVLDGRSWHTYLPIPYLWNNIYYKHPIFNENTYTMVDFL